MSANLDIRTPQTDPDHEVIGQYFMDWTPALYFCDSHVRGWGYWMTNVLDQNDRHNVSERAIHRTFHLQHGLVRPHHEHHPENTYYSVNLKNPNQEPQPVPTSDPVPVAPADTLVFFDLYYACDFLRNLRRAHEEKTKG